MSTSSKERFRRALVETAEAFLERGDAVEWPGLGTLRVKHQSSTIRRPSQDEAVIEPPREEIIFEAESREAESG